LTNQSISFSPRLILVLFIIFFNSSEDKLFKIKTWHLERSGEIISKLGFSVVAPIKIISPVSIKGKRKSC